MKFYFEFQVGTKVLVCSGVLFSFFRCWRRESDHFKTKSEPRRTTKTFEKNRKIFPKH